MLSVVMETSLDINVGDPLCAVVNPSVLHIKECDGRTMIKGKKVYDQEEEFVKLNEELELEAQELLQEFNNAIKRQETEPEKSFNNMNENSEAPSEIMSKNHHFVNQKSEEDPRKSLPATHLERSKCDKVDKSINNLPIPAIGGNIALPHKLMRHKSEVRMREKLDGNLVPDSVQNMGTDGVLRFLKAKVQILTEQLENVQKDERKLVEKVKELQADRERVSEDRDKWIQQANIAKNLLSKHEQHTNDVIIQLQSSQAENGSLKKEVEKLKKELKQVSQGAGTNEVRLNRANEEVERLKSTLRQIKQEEKDSREVQKKRNEELTATLKRIEKQKLELLHAFKKQLVVIDGLKKQKGLADASKILKTTEDDFMEFLDWNPSKN